LKVVAKFNLGADEEISGYSLSTPDMSTSGTKTVTVTYENDGQTFTTTFEITVRDLDYSPLEYITTNGTQYLDTGIKTTANTKIVITMDKPTDFTGNTWLFNSQPRGGGTKTIGFNVKDNGGFTLDYAGKRYGTPGASNLNVTTGTINWAEGKNVLTIGNGEFKINDSVLATGLENVTDLPATSTANLVFFTSLTTDSTTYFPAKVYSIAIYNGDTLVMNLIPAQELDGQTRVGFYDTVSGNWFFSAVNGTAFAGPTA
jgi:hypothetical protein